MIPPPVMVVEAPPSAPILRPRAFVEAPLTLSAAPPPAVLHAEEQVIAFLERHRFSFTRIPDIQVAEFAPLAADSPCPGCTFIAEALPGLVLVSGGVAAEGVTVDLVHTLLHETLHETVTGGVIAGGIVDYTAWLANEQATESLARDLLPGLVRRRFVHLRMRDSSLIAYQYLVRDERLWSGRVCRCPWGSTAARAVRARFFFQSPGRRLLVTSVS